MWHNEVISLLSFLQNKRPNLKPVIQLAFESGLRFEDILKLKNKDIQKYNAHYSMIRFKRSKKWNAPDDLVFISQDLLENIREFYPKFAYYLFDSLSREKRSCSYGKLRYWIRQSLKHVLSLKEESMKGIGFHITRRTFMSVGVIMGSFSFEEGSRNLGHTSVRVTEKHYFFLRRNPENSLVNYFKIQELKA